MDRIILSQAAGNINQRLRFFAVLNLGVTQSLVGGIISAAEAIRFFTTPRIAFTRARVFGTSMQMRS